MDDIQLINLINLLAPQYGLSIDWETSDIETRELNFNGGTDDQIWEFCIALDDLFKGDVE